MRAFFPPAGEGCPIRALLKRQIAEKAEDAVELKPSKGRYLRTKTHSKQSNLFFAARDARGCSGSSVVRHAHCRLSDALWQCFFRPLRGLDILFARIPQACAWGYHLAPASRALPWSSHNRRNLRRPTLAETALRHFLIVANRIEINCKNSRGIFRARAKGPRAAKTDG